MTVKQLINKLKKFPEDAIVTLVNDSSYEDGEYKASEAKFYEDNTVEIFTDYTWIMDYEKHKWRR